MSSPSISLAHAEILVLATFGRDAETLVEIITRIGAQGRTCASGSDLCHAFNESTAVILVTEEALAEATDQIRHCLGSQPAWSDVPVIVLSSANGRSGAPARWNYFRQFGNVTILARPLSAQALMIAVEAACRARAWQYVVRDQMRRLEIQAAELEQQVRERTDALREEAEERKRIESALNEARRLEAIGRLAGGVAHDFNNLLQVISGACSLLPYAQGDPARMESLANTIQRASERGSKLTQHMLAFGRRQVLATDALDIVQHLMGMKELLQQALREKITLELRLQADLWHAHADVTQLEVALLNLAVNAKDVLPSGGTVTLAARNIRLPSPQVPEAGDLNGDFVWLTVSDNGPGMPAEIAAKAFDPFFTTKRVGEGSGLGLSQVYGFARQSGGVAWIRSGERGTSISMLLPRGITARPSSQENQGRNDDDGARLRGVRVLCVEDDETVREVTISLLNALGCTTSWARNGDEALQMDMRNYDLVFSDVLMPGSMDGIELAKAIAMQCPNLPVVLASGYVIAPERLDELHIRLLAKPYDVEALRRALLDALG